MVNYLTGTPRDVNEKFELLRSKTNFAVSNRNPAGGRVNAKISDLNDRIFFSAYRDAAEVRTDPRQELIHAEWLGHVIVSAGIECFDLLLLFVADGENYDRNLRRSSYGTA